MDAWGDSGPQWQQSQRTFIQNLSHLQDYYMQHKCTCGITITSNQYLCEQVKKVVEDRFMQTVSVEAAKQPKLMALDMWTEATWYRSSFTQEGEERDSTPLTGQVRDSTPLTGQDSRASSQWNSILFTRQDSKTRAGKMDVICSQTALL